MKIGIYGGTFNPIHLGHMEAARFAMEFLELDRLHLIPTGIPPHKRMDANAPGAEQRLEMVRLAAEALGPDVQVDDLELRRKGRSYTLDTLRQLRDRYPKDQLYLLMGTDMFLTFHRWRDPEKIAGMCTLCAFGRSEKDSEELFSVQRAYLRENFGADVITITLPHIVDISSTRLREHLVAGEGRRYLDPAVYGFILREGLYGLERDLKALPLDELRCVALSMLRHKRVPHVLGTEQTAAELALRWGEDEETARRAALLHDCTKKLNGEQHRVIFRQYGVVLDGVERDEEKLYHAISGAAVAKHIFGVSDEIESAIRWHTTGKADMTTLEKIIYLADYIEPTRDFCDLTEMRAMAFRDLDRAMLLGLEMSIESLEKRGVAVNSYSVRARDYLKGKRHEEG
ncbi:MAG: nicotinate (nicotinamide) nucleotide adenylyltransferase [Oscillospiraceae bacterium]|nr:nicotinate (nicotinamide) nucleotide adenylyltransferase [Oscillospiraceae bacterium]